MEPVRNLSGGLPERVLISPDGLLNFLPFQALVDEEGRFLIDRDQSKTAPHPTLRPRVETNPHNRTKLFDGSHHPVADAAVIASDTLPPEVQPFTASGLGRR